MNKPKLVKIDWVDSQQEIKVWQNPVEIQEEYKKYGLDPMVTVGYLVDKTQEYALVARDLHFNSEGNIPYCGGFMAIPTGCIKNITYLKDSQTINKRKK